MSAIDELRVLVDTLHNGLCAENVPFQDELHKLHALLPELEGPVRQQSADYRYALRILKHLAPQCDPLGDMAGVLCQIDNCLAGSLKLKPEPFQSSPFRPGMRIGTGHGRATQKTLVELLVASEGGREGWRCTDGKMWIFWPDDVNRIIAAPPEAQFVTSMTAELSQPPNQQPLPQPKLKPQVGDWVRCKSDVCMRYRSFQLHRTDGILGYDFRGKGHKLTDLEPAAPAEAFASAATVLPVFTKPNLTDEQQSQLDTAIDDAEDPPTEAHPAEFSGPEWEIMETSQAVYARPIRDLLAAIRIRDTRIDKLEQELNSLKKEKQNVVTG